MTDLAAAFKELCDEYGIDPESNDYSGEEDARLYLDPDEDEDYALAPWVVVSHAGEYTYLKCYASRGDAISHAFENVSDDLYAEAPSAIVNLETGARLVPDFDQCPWKPQ